MMKNFRPFFFHVALALIFIFGLQALNGSTTREPFNGITHIERTDWPEIPRPVKAQILIIDLNAEGLSFRLTEPCCWNHPDPEQAYTELELTLDYLQRVDAQIAINAHFYETVRIRGRTYADLRFLAASDGVPYSKIEGAEPALNIDGNNNANIVTRGAGAPTYETSPSVDLHNAIGGSERLVFQGDNTAGGGTGSYYDPRARTATALTQDNETLIVIVVDEGLSGLSEGVTPGELADMLIEYNAWDAVMFDGGGSTNMAMADPDPRLVAGTGSRSVGSNLAIYAVPVDTQAAEEVIIDNSDSGFTASANWEVATSADDQYGDDYRWRYVEAISDPATWAADLPAAGIYSIYARWSAGQDRSQTAPYIVHHTLGSDTIHMNQQGDGGQWNLLGSFELEAGINEVQLSCWTSNGDIVVADAIRWVKE